MKREKPVNHIETIRSIANKSKGAGIKKALSIPELSIMQKFLGCTAEESLLLCLICTLSVSEESPGIGDLAKYLGLDNISFLNYIRYIRKLQRKGLVYRSKSYRDKGIADMQFFIPSMVIEAITSGDQTEMINSPISSPVSLFSRIGRLVKMVDQEIISKDEYLDEVQWLVNANPEHFTIRNLQKFRLSQSNMAILLTICSEYVKGVDDIEMSEVLSTVFEDQGESFIARRELITGKSPLVRKKLLRLETSYFKTDRFVHLTDKAFNELFETESKLDSQPKSTSKDLITHDSITPRRLFYNDHEKEQITQIQKFLTKQSYSKIIQELERNNMAKGFAILFHGSPGTGKTEAVYQLARKLKKSIMPVDISQTKDMFFGESEKKIKEVFDNYRKLVKNSTNCPILLFNEADAVLGKRKEITSSNVAQTENAMQNIILQEMEQLNGIMMATTNLTTNLDKAFERRFLYKVNFTQPDPSVMAQIWKEHINSLKASETFLLSDRFPLSGGQIANIARKVISGKIIHQRPITLNEVIAFCEDERLDKGVRRVGF